MVLVLYFADCFHLITFMEAADTLSPLEVNIVVLFLSRSRH